MRRSRIIAFFVVVRIATEAANVGHFFLGDIADGTPISGAAKNGERPLEDIARRAAADVGHFVHGDIGGGTPETGGVPALEDIARDAATTNTVSSMLLGGITYVMGLFYLVNWPDKDIRVYSWQIIGNTISIFVAVLFFRACQNCVMRLADDQFCDILLVKTLQMLLWLGMLQVTTGLLCGGIGVTDDGTACCAPNVMWRVLHPAGGDAPGDEIDAEELVLEVDGHGIYFKDDEYGFVTKCKGITDMEQDAVDALTCYSGVLSHITAFAAIACFGHVQHMTIFARSWRMSLLATPASFIILSILFSTARWLWTSLCYRGGGTDQRHEEIWTDVSTDCERDVVSLASSFVTIQSIRYMVTGRLPKSDGNIHLSIHDPAAIPAAWVLGLTFLILALGLVLHIRWYRRNKHSLSGHVLTIVLAAQSYTLTVASWSIVFAAEYLILYLCSSRPANPRDSFYSVTLSVCITIIVFLIIFQLKRIVALDVIGDDTDFALVSLIKVLGVSTGFAWEASFAEAVQTLSVHVRSEFRLTEVHVVQFIVSVLVCLIVLPAYRLTIFPAVSRHNYLFKKEWEQKDQRLATRLPTVASGSVAFTSSEESGSVQLTKHRMVQQSGSEPDSDGLSIVTVTSSEEGG